MIDLNQFDGHTPRPWVHDDYETYIFGPNMEMVGETRGTGEGLPQGINGKLMAAAPDLLAECKRQAEVIRPMKQLLDAYKRRIAGFQLDYEHEVAIIENAENALAKLEGEK